MEHIAWMAWTLPTAIFFVMLALTLGAMTWLAAVYPEAERVGVLRIPTTRGDRLFISLVLSAVIHLLWIAFVGTDPIATLRPASLPSPSTAARARTSIGSPSGVPEPCAST